MFQAWRPPRGGWKIVTLPARFEDRDLRFAWEARKPRINGDHKSAVEEMATFLRKNGHKDNKELRREILEHGERQWRAREPHRFAKNSALSSAQQKPKTAATRKMGWARNFWETSNALLASDLDDPLGALLAIVHIGKNLVKGKTGCEHCAEHFARLMAKYPPTKTNGSIRHARVWLWRIHNASREGLPPTPYAQIALAWNWPRLTPVEIHGILGEMGMQNVQ